MNYYYINIVTISIIVADMPRIHNRRCLESFNIKLKFNFHEFRLLNHL